MSRKKQAQPVTANELEFSVDPKEAAKALDAKNEKGAAKKPPAARTDQKVIDRAVELRNEGLGLVRITNKLTEEGHKSATGKELRPQTVRQLLLRALNTDHLREAADSPAKTQPVDLKGALEQSVENSKSSAIEEAERKKKVAEGIGVHVEH